ncbi:hypothetical protein OS493_031178 [Desmophyllum pertusum]|uniref:EF-hand domain-containing protein n=1 Tax=Desmophyllum pertusum TaxID=174260 RepID=A0A9X0D274_9CNID|nr:hypothetical protein OS493_031178 [Desmophyllum pertusum]
MLSTILPMNGLDFRFRLSTELGLGHVQEIEILPGIKRQMKTLSMRPLVFEIPDFLDEDECELIIALAENKKLRDNPKTTDNRGIYYEDPLNTFKQWDLNGDEYIDPEEIVLIPGKMDLKFTEHNATQMLKTLEMDKDENGLGKIDLTEFKSIELERIGEYIGALLNDSTMMRIPNSKVSWLWHDEDELLRYQPELMDGFHERLQAITKIPKEILQESEPMQVLQFEENNYQYCHQDSEPKIERVPCCLYGDMKECRICRYITVAYFLNDVDDGGEVVFPLAKQQDDVMNNSGNWTGFFTYDKTTGSRNSFEVDIQFKMDGANRVLYGKGNDDSGEFELIDSLLTGDMIRFRKKYLKQGKNDVSIKYAGRLKGNTQIDGKWWIPGVKKMHGRFFIRHNAYEENLVIKPERGKAVMWYNHVLNDDGTWIGGLDNRMYYGHCDVNEGEKWIASNWINVDGDGNTVLRAWKRGTNLISETKKHLNQNILQRMQKDKDNHVTDVIEEEFNSDMENAQDWTFETPPKERHVLNAVVSLLEALKQEELRDVSKYVHEKLGMLCIPLVLNQGDLDKQRISECHDGNEDCLAARRNGETDDILLHLPRIDGVKTIRFGTFYDPWKSMKSLNLDKPIITDNTVETLTNSTIGLV